MGIKNLITLLSFLFVLFSCEKEEFEPEINQRTTFMYFPWSEDLIDYFYNNISDMEYAIKETGLKNERVIVFLSTSSIWIFRQRAISLDNRALPFWRRYIGNDLEMSGVL